MRWDRRAGGLVWGLMLSAIAIELILVAADAGWIGSTRWRGLAYQYGAFWPGLLDDWRPSYPLQPWVMFVSYAFLHGDLTHLIGNMITLFALGRLVHEAAGTAGVAVVYGVSMLGGAVFFSVLSDGPTPMVGASGALFGLAGALLTWEWGLRRAEGAGLWPVIRIALFLVLINIVMWVWLEGRLAWQAHFGGAVAGWFVARLWPEQRM